MAQIRQEINITNAVLSGGSAGANSSEIIQLDTAQYNGTVTFYFEAVGNRGGSGVNDVTITLRRNGTSTDDATLTFTTADTASTLKRSASFTPPAGVTEYLVRCSGTVSQGSASAKTARIIVIQNASPITTTETQIEVGSASNTTSLTSVPLTNPKYWKYTSANWDGSKNFYFEATFQNGTTKSAATASLQVADGTGDGFVGWADVASSPITTTSITPVRIRSAPLTLTAGRNYRVAIKSSSTKETVTIYNAKIIVGQADIKTGLQLYYALDEAGSALTAIDDMNNAQATVAGVTWQAGKINNGCKFPGTNNNIGTITNTLPNFANITLSVWVKATNTGQTSKYIIRDYGGGTDWAFHLGQDTTNVYTCGVHYGSTYKEVVSTTAVTTASFVHLAMTFDGRYIRIWVNGVNETTFDNGSVAVVDSANKTFYLGCLNPTTQTTTALIDEVAIYNITLQTGQIAALYNNGTGRQASTYTPITLLEAQYLLSNTLLAAGTALQLFLTKWDSTEWSGVTNTYTGQAEAANGSTSVIVLQEADAGSTLATISSPDNAGTAAATMPTSQNLDVKASTNNGDVYASRILVAVTNTSPTVALNTPNDSATGVSTTPDLVFTGTDTQADEIEYNVQISTNNTFTPIFVSKSNSGVLAAVTTFNWNHTVAAGFNRSLLVTVQIRDDATTVSGITWNGVALTKATSIQETTWTPHPRSEAWYLVAPAVGTYSIAVTLSAAADQAMAIASDWTNTSQTNPINTFNTLQGTATASVAKSLSVVTTVANTVLMHSIYTNATYTTITDGAGQTNLYILAANAGTDGALGSYKTVSAAGLASMQYTETEGADYAFVVVAIAPYNKYSVTPDATFTDVTNGADTHPFASADQLKYTIQAGDILANLIVYYWRVAAKDPSGTNTYGAWATTRSFTTVTAVALIPNKIYLILQAVKRASTF